MDAIVELALYFLESYVIDGTMPLLVDADSESESGAGPEQEGVGGR